MYGGARAKGHVMLGEVQWKGHTVQWGAWRKELCGARGHMGKEAYLARGRTRECTKKGEHKEEGTQGKGEGKGRGKGKARERDAKRSREQKRGTRWRTGKGNIERKGELLQFQL